MIHRYNGAVIPHLLKKLLHLLFAVCHKGVVKRRGHSEKVHMSFVMCPFHRRYEGQTGDFWKAEILAVVIVVRDGDEMQAGFFAFFARV